jgi:hypothetical protein
MAGRAATSTWANKSWFTIGPSAAPKGDGGVRIVNKGGEYVSYHIVAKDAGKLADRIADGWNELDEKGFEHVKLIAVTTTKAHGVARKKSAKAKKTAK